MHAVSFTQVVPLPWGVPHPRAVWTITAQNSGPSPPVVREEGITFRAIFRARQPTRKKRTSRQSREVQTEVRPVGDSRDEAPPHS